VKLTFYLFLWFHVMTCLWFLVIKINQNEVDEDGTSLRWYPPYDWINYNESVLLKDGELSLF